MNRICVIFFILINHICFAQSKTQSTSKTDPYTILSKVISYSNKTYFEGACEIGYAQGDSYFDFSKMSRQLPSIIVNYSVAVIKYRSATEGGTLRNFRYANNGNFNTRVLVADWQNFDKTLGSGTFEMSLLDENNPNTIYIGISGKSWKYYINIKLGSEQFEEIKRILSYVEKIGSLDIIKPVSDYDNWQNAVDNSEILGNGWRLPNAKELKYLRTIGTARLKNNIYWSSEELPNDFTGIYSIAYDFLKNVRITDNKKNKHFIIYVNGALEESSNNSEILIGNIIVKKRDLGRMDWWQAVDSCKKLGDGWRLPTKEEIELLYQNKNKIGGFEDDGYWTSKEVDEHNAWVQSFYKNLNGPNAKFDALLVRPVKSN